MSLHAWSDYARVSEAAGVTVRNLGPGECLRAASLLTQLWGGEPMSSPVLVAMQYAGTYVSGAFRDDEIVGVCAGFLGPPNAPSMHSHVAGVRGTSASTGVGTALKFHQRAWCLDRDVATITWTFDPLVARNAAFNVRRLGAALERYVVDFYGPMVDGVNAGQGSDRIVARWSLDKPIPVTPAEPGDAPSVLWADADGEPRVSGAPGDAKAVTIGIPGDIHALRTEDPSLGARWRLALREAMEPRFANGWRPTAVGRDGRYVMEKQ